MTQSVELLLDEPSEDQVREQWARLAAAGLPTEQRQNPSPSHRPHITLYAADALAPGAEDGLTQLMAGLELRLRLGSVQLFGPRRGQVVVVRAVVASRALLDLQEAVGTACGANPGSTFGPGRWTPHVTLARRCPVDQVGDVLAAAQPVLELDAIVRDCRRWDSDRKQTWLVS